MASRLAPMPFAHLNLRYNPFGEIERSQRARVAIVEPWTLRPGDLVQIIGDSGRGKTTQLLALQAAHAGAVYELVPEGANRVVRDVPPGVVLLVDEAQRLARAHLERLLARPGALVLGTHRDLSASSRRAMRSVLLSGLAAAHLSAIVDARIEAARGAPGPVPRIGRGALAHLIARHGDDVRAIEHHLYDVFQSLEGPIDVEL